MLRKAAREAAFFAAYLLLSIALTWPLARNLTTSVSDLGDPLLVSWILDWTSHALLHQPLRLFHSPVFHPSLMPHAYSEHLTGIALFILPFHVAGVSPLAVHNIALLLGFALSGYGAFVLARMAVPSNVAAFIGGLFFAFVPFRFDHLPHLQIIFSGWLPLVLAALLAYRRKPDWKHALWFGGAYAMNGLTNIYFLLFATAALGATLIVLFFVDQNRGFKYWLRIVVALVLAGAVLLPFLLPYRIVSDKYNMKRPENEVMHGSGALSDWLRSSARSLLYGETTPGDRHLAEREIFPGIMAILLMACAILMTPRRERLPGTSTTSDRLLRALDVLIVFLFIVTILAAISDPRFRIRALHRTWISIRGTDIPFMLLLVVTLARLSLRLPTGFGGPEKRSLRDSVRDSRFGLDGWMGALWIAVGALGALGLHAFFYRFLYERIEIYRSMRALGRWAVIAYVGMAIWVALGAWAVLARRSGRQRTVASAALIGLTLLDLFPSIQWEQALVQTPQVYRWLNRERKGPVLELPVDNWLAFRYLLGATQHRVTLMNGSSGWEGPTYSELRHNWEATKDYARVLGIAEENGAKVFIVHEHWMNNVDAPKFKGVLRDALQSGRIGFVRRFDHGVEGDFVFAITRNFPDWQRLRMPEVPDGAGHLPAQMLAHYLDGQPTYNATTFGKLESPHYFQVLQGPLQVRGWGISPHGISNVYVHVDERSQRFEAHRTRRPDCNKYPWYFEHDCGFEFTFPDRPAGVARYTDVQIELVDGAGKHTWLDDHVITWRHSRDEIEK